MASPEGTINYVYGTAAGNGKDRLIRTYTAHDDQSYTYDAMGRLATVTANIIRGVTLNEAGSYVYDLNGNLRSWSLTGRATSLHIYSYDELNRLTTLTRQNFTEPMTWNYATDKVGRKTTDGTKFRWEYDALGRLTREQYDANTNWTLDSANDYITTFAYDLVGNRKKKVTDKLGTASDETVTYVYNSRDELTSETSTLSGSTTYIYDANGSLTSKTKGTAVETYGYDKRNKMTSYTSSTGVVTSYKYDDEGLRVQRKVGTAATTLYLLNHHNLTGYAVAFEERSGTSTSMPVVAYVVGHDVVRQSQDAAGTGTTDGHLHLAYDGQGNMRGNVGTINVGPTTIFATVGGTRDYSAFGELISGSLISNLRHHGEYFDGITGFYFQGVRQRATFAWVQDDDYQGNKQYPLTLHKRGFVHQDPINGTDPTGQFLVGFIDVLVSGGINSILSYMEGKTGNFVMQVAQKTSSGIFIDQAITLAMIDWTKGVALDLATAGGVYIGGRIVARAATFATGRIRGVVKILTKEGAEQLVHTVPGTLLTRDPRRIIPGGVGGAIGGNRDKLREAILAGNGIIKGTPLDGQQAHHIIPAELVDHRILNDIGMDLDDATNGMLLSTSIHRGPHREYTNAITQALDAIPMNLSPQDKMNRVYEIQAKVVNALNTGNASLTVEGRTSFDAWTRILNENPWF